MNAIALPGVVHDLPASEYHAHPALSSSVVADMALMPPAQAQAKWLRRRLADEKRAADPAPANATALEFGTVAHTAILEPDAIEREYMVAERPNLRTNAGKEQWAESHAMARALGKVLVSQEDYDTARAMRDALHRLPAASLLRSGHAEVSLFAHDPDLGVDLRSREDWMPTEPGIQLDVKTARSVSPEDFGRDAIRLGYHVKAAHYRRVRQLLSDEPPTFVWLAIEKEPPYLAADYWVEPGMWPAFESEWRRAVATWKDCTESGAWPLRAEGEDYIHLPAWYRRRNGLEDESWVM